MREELEGRRVLVTGASGFLGGHLVRSLVERGARVTALARPGGNPAPDAAAMSVDAVAEADVCDPAALRRAIREHRPQLVYHLASVTSIRLLRGDWQAVHEGVRVNLVGTLNLLEALQVEGRETTRLVRAGGLEEYGAGATPYREEQREQPVSPYSASQVAAAHYCQMLQAELPFDVVTLRPALIYGPGQSTDFFIPAVIRSLLAGRDFDMTQGDQSRDLLHVDDAIDAFLAAGVRPGLRGTLINVGSGREYLMRDVARLIERIVGMDARVNLGARAERPSELKNLVADSTRALELLGWRARVTLEDGLARTAQWYRDEAAAQGSTR